MPRLKLERTSGNDIAEEIPVNVARRDLLVVMGVSLLTLAVGGGGLIASWLKSIEGGDCSLDDDIPDEVRRWCSLVEKYSKQNGLSSNLVGFMIWYESGGNPEAVSSSQACGLMQMVSNSNMMVNSATGNRLFEGRPSCLQLQDPDFNLGETTEMLGGLISEYGIYDGIKRYGPSPNYLQRAYGDGDYYVKKVLHMWQTYAPEDYNKHYKE